MSPITVESGHAFATVGDTTLELDIYRAQDHDTPLVIYAHAGGWRGGDKTYQTAKRIAPLARYGITVAASIIAWFPPPPFATSSRTSGPGPGRTTPRSALMFERRYR